MARGLSTVIYYLTKHYAGGMLGWGPKYQLVVVQQNAAKGLQQVSPDRVAAARPDAAD